MIGARTSSKLCMSINRLLVPPSSSPFPLLPPQLTSPKICGLGNPGPKYKNTRHSIGLLFLDHLRSHLRYPAFQPDSHTQGEWSNPTAEYVLFKSSRYMNLSGRSVEGAYRKVGGQGWGALCVVHDDLEVALGEFKVRQSGRGKYASFCLSCL
jgi:peptidyl-tRNA hydrolase